MNTAREFVRALGLSEVNSGVAYGPFVGKPEGVELASISPVDGKPIATVLGASASDYERVLQAALDGQRRLRAVPAPKRAQMVRDIGDELRANKRDLARLVSLEMGKILPEAEGEVQEMIDMADLAVGQGRMLYGLNMPSERPGHRIMEQWHPLGIVGVITAFNFPVAVYAWNAFLAVVCGNSVIWKPSSQTPLCAIAVQRIMHRVAERHGLGEGVFNLLVGSGSIVGESMLPDRRIALVSFTGSTPMGRRVAENVAARLGRTILELGGNNAAVVMADANLALATRAILFGAVGTAGQRCTSTRRVLAHGPIADKLTAKLMDAWKQVRLGDPLQEGTTMGPLVSREAVADMQKALRTIREQGGEILCGGQVMHGKGFESGCYVSPALVKALPGMPMVKEETFAPILYIIEVADLGQAIAVHNDVPQGLSSSIFTTSMQAAETFLSVEGSDCGMANVNAGTSGAEIGGAFGGEKETGGGREAGSDAWKQYMRRLTSAINFSDALPLAQGIEFGED